MASNNQIIIVSYRTISEVRDMKEFPDLSASVNLEVLRFDRASITKVPSYICVNLSRLRSFDVHSNRIAEIPNLSACKEALNINLGNNEITSLEGKPFKGLNELRDLTLGHNYIKYIPEDAFEGLVKLQYLDLVHNRITKIHSNAFLPLGALDDLNLGENQFDVLPTKGLQNVQELKTYHNTFLKEFPKKKEFPKIQTLILSYAYHCCDFLQSETGTQKNIQLTEDIVWLAPEETNMGMWDKHENMSKFWQTHLDNLSLDTSIAEELFDNFGSYDYDFQDIPLPPEAEHYLEDYKPRDYTHDLVMAKPPVTCKPKPGPFMPCDDLFGWWSLRCGVWFVFMLALLGNGVVLFVSVTSKSKMDVPRFLICNLACADFFMGVYLGFLAIVDASTLGEFKKHAIWWQLSPGCLIAGFLGVLSSELSVYTLTVITLERFYAITHAMQLNKRLSLRHAGYIMTCGWLYSIALASLPLFGISDYRKFAVCLPFEISDVFSKAYVCYIMIFNGISFFTILSCYLIMYLSIRQSQAWNSSDTRVAKRMALLVFTDFLCWAPIAFLSLASAFGKNLVHLNEAKVLTIFVLPLNSCANPFLYAIFTKQFKKDCVSLCRRLEDSTIGRHFSRASHRPVSFTWGSSRRPSGLNSLVHAEKRGSCSNSGSSGGGNYNYNGDFGQQQWTRKDNTDCGNQGKDSCDTCNAKLLHAYAGDRSKHFKNTHSKYTCRDPSCRAVDSYIIIHKEFSPKKKKVVDDIYSTMDTYVKTDSGGDDIKKTKTKQHKGERKKKGRKNEMILPIVSFHGTKEAVMIHSDDASKKNKCVIPCCSAHSSPTDSHKCCDYEIVSAYIGKNGILVPRDIKCLIHGDTITDLQGCQNKDSKYCCEPNIDEKQHYIKANDAVEKRRSLSAGEATETDDVLPLRENIVPVCMSKFLPGEPPVFGKLGKEKIDKKAQMNFFTQSLAEHEFVHSAVCRSNSLVELAQHQLADLYTCSSSSKRFSLTPRQEGYMLLHRDNRDSAYIDDVEGDPDDDDLSNISDLHSSDACKSDCMDTIFEPPNTDKCQKRFYFPTTRRQTKHEAASQEEHLQLMADNQDFQFCKFKSSNSGRKECIKMPSSDVESTTLPSNPSCDVESGFISEN
ncbi:hypothetical protein SNE40_003629 [Patella caerulea]|uniref:G-protein coupled receptors family 1 profile domain-containing protein n=1 Tax=Patella caerulea TaxID=87958 RepID=A0AAN8KBN4_PATCE